MQCVKLRAKKDIMVIPELGGVSVKVSDVLVIGEQTYGTRMQKQYGESFEVVGSCVMAKLRNGMYEFEKAGSAVKDAAQALSPSMPSDPEPSAEIADKSMQAKTKTRRK